MSEHVYMLGVKEPLWGAMGCPLVFDFLSLFLGGVGYVEEIKV